MKQYYYLLRYTYKIVIVKYPELFDVNRLQIAVKVVNNIVKLNELILTLLIFEIYFKITKLNFFNLIIK